MATGVGTLTVSLGLDAAQFTQGLTKAQVQAKQLGDALAAQVAKGTLLGNLFTDLTHELVDLPGRFVDLIKSSIDAADHLNDLSKKTGIAVETLGGIGFAASQAGGDLESAVAATGKLNKSLAEAASGGEQAGEAFKLLGINVKNADGTTKDAGAALAEIADKFASYRDGPEKAALALRIFGKAGADIIPLLDDGGKKLLENIDYYKRFSGVTKETAEAADQFNDTLVKVNLLSGSFGRTLAAEMLPKLQALADLWLTNKENGDNFKSFATEVVDVLSNIASAAAFVITGFLELGKVIGGNAAIAAALASGDIKLAKAIAAELDADINGYEARLAGLQAALSNVNKTAAPEVDLRTRPIDFGYKDAPRLAPKSTGAKPDDPTKKELDNQLKAIEGQIARERDLLATRNDFIELYNSQNLFSIAKYYELRRSAQDDAAKAEVDGYTKEIAALRDYQAKSSTSLVDRAGAEVKITELTDKRSKAETAAGAAGIRLSLQQSAAMEEYRKTVLGVVAQVDELSGNLASAAAIRFDLQFDVLKKTFTNEGNQLGLAAIDTLRAAAIATAALQKAAEDSARTMTQIGLAEDRVALAQQTGAIGELQGLVKLGEARRGYIPLLESQVAAEEAIAKAATDAGTVGAEKLTLQAEQARLALDKLKASADPLAASLNKTFGDDFNTSLTDFVTGTKSAADAFKSFSKSVLNDILKLGTKSITDSIFGGSGGIGGLISSVFNGGKSVAPTTAIAGAASSPTSSALDSLAGSAKSAASAIGDGLTSAVSTGVSAFSSFGDSLASLGADFGSTLSDIASSIAGAFSSSSGGGGSTLGGLADLFSGFFADGGTIKPGQFGIVGENGPEVAFGGSNGKTISPMQRGNTQNINVNVQGTPGMSRATAQQQGRDIGVGIQRSLARNN